MSATAESRITAKAWNLIDDEWDMERGHIQDAIFPGLRAAIHETAREAARAVCQQCRTDAPHPENYWHWCKAIREAFPAAFENQT